MKQQARECFESVRAVLKQDEQAILDSLELDLRKTRTRLDQVLKGWVQHQEQITKTIGNIQTALSGGLGAEQDVKVRVNSWRPT